MPTPSEADTFRTRLYLISPSEIDLNVFEIAFKNALAGGDVACFQLRLKNSSISEINDAVLRLRPIAEAANVAFLLNDDVALARDLGVDGVHIGQDDMPYREARTILGPDAIIGVTCKNSRDLAIEAAESGADYVAFGAFYPSTTKSPTVAADLELLEWWSSMVEIPSVAIGGITVENAAALIVGGADFLAVSAGVWEFAEGPEAAVRAFNRVIDKALATC